MSGLFSAFKFVDGELVQFDEIINSIKPAPGPEPGPGPGPEPPVDPLNPLGLPPFTIRVKYKAGTEPGSGGSSSKLESATKIPVSAADNTWDVTYEDQDWSSLFYKENNLVEILGANTSRVSVFGGGVTLDTHGCFESCESLTTVALFDTSMSVTMASMFASDSSLRALPLFSMKNALTLDYMCQLCESLQEVPPFSLHYVRSMVGTFNKSGITSLPAFDMQNVFDIDWMCNQCHRLTAIPSFTNTGNIISAVNVFAYCEYVQHGALALYQQLSANPSLNSMGTFSFCGMETETGYAELMQIPESWGGEYQPDNPLHLPDYTIRCKYSSGESPHPQDQSGNPIADAECTLVDAGENIWDITYEDSNWSYLLSKEPVVSILGGNMFHVSDTGGMFYSCDSLETINVVRRGPVYSVSHMFDGCTNVTSGALAMYNYLIARPDLPNYYGDAFSGCGKHTVSGAAELAQIPTSWGGTMQE